jgi:hypothetical protein
MKHAITGLRGQIHRVLDKADSRTVEISEELATAALALIAARKPAILVDGRITNLMLEREAGNIMRWDEATSAWQITPRFVPVPRSITAWQAKAGLAMTPHPQAGTMLAAAEAALAAMPEGAEKIVVLSAWNNNANFERTSPTILSFGTALGMTSDDLDNLFRLGGSLTV